MPDPVPGPPRPPDVVGDVRGRLADLEAQPMGAHVAAYDEVHRMLQDSLARLDEG